MHIVRENFQNFAIAWMVITLGLAGYSFARSETANSQAKTAIHRTSTDAETAKSLSELNVKNALVAKGLAESVANEKIAETTDRVKNEETLCGKINSVIEYNRHFSTNSLKQSEYQAKKIEEVINGKTNLTRPEINFVKLYLSSILALEKGSPTLLNLKPYNEPNLNCKSLSKKIEESSKPIVK